MTVMLLDRDIAWGNVGTETSTKHTPGYIGVHSETNKTQERVTEARNAVTGEEKLLRVKKGTYCLKAALVEIKHDKRATTLNWMRSHIVLLFKKNWAAGKESCPAAIALVESMEVLRNNNDVWLGADIEKTRDLVLKWIQLPVSFTTEILNCTIVRGIVMFGQKAVKTLTTRANAFAGRADGNDGFPSQMNCSSEEPSSRFINAILTCTSTWTGR